MEHDRRSDTSVGARMRTAQGWANWSGPAARPAPDPAEPAPASGSTLATLADPDAFREVTHDATTALPNLALFHDRLDGALKRAARSRTFSLALLRIRIDTHAEVARRFGNRAAESLMETTAARLTTAVRTTDTVSRVHTDEFAVVLEGLQNASLAERLTRDIAKALTRPTQVLTEPDGTLQHVSPQASIGVAVWPLSSASQRKVLSGARAALTEAAAASLSVYRNEIGAGASPATGRAR